MNTKKETAVEKENVTQNECQKYLLERIKEYTCEIKTNKFNNSTVLKLEKLKHFYVYNSESQDKMDKSVYNQINKTCTSIGQTYLKQNIKCMNYDIDLINNRHEIVDKIMHSNGNLLNTLKKILNLKFYFDEILKDQKIFNPVQKELFFNDTNEFDDFNELCFYQWCIDTIINCVTLHNHVDKINDELRSLKIETIEFDISFMDGFIKNTNIVKDFFQNKMIEFILPETDEYLDIALEIYKQNVLVFYEYLQHVSLNTPNTQIEIHKEQNGVYLKVIKDDKYVENKAFTVHKENTKYFLYTNTDIDTFNFKLKQCTDQISELFGRRYNEFINENTQYFLILHEQIMKIGEIDLCCSMYLHKKTNKFVNATIHTENFMELKNIRPHFLFCKEKELETCTFQTEKPFNILHGPNSSGKTSFCINLIQCLLLNQMGFGINQSECKINIFKNIAYITSPQQLNEIENVPENSFVFIDKVSVNKKQMEILTQKNAFTLYITHSEEIIK